MAPTNAVELTTDDFGRWARRAGLALPVPLNAGHAGRVELGWDELLEVSEDRLRVTNAAASPELGRSPALREMLRYASGILGAPSTAIYAVRTERVTASESTVIGLSSGADGLVVVDSATTARLVRLPATELAGAVAAALPALRGLPLQRFELSDRALATLRGAGTAAPSAQVTRMAAQASGLPPEWLDDLIRLQQVAAAAGLIGAVRYRDGTAVPGTVSAQWFEGPSGAVLRREDASGHVTFEPATRSTLTSAMVAAAAAPFAPVRRADGTAGTRSPARLGAAGTSTTTNNARVRALGESR
jgi:hypothetical protein